MTENKKIGDRGEAIAKKYLEESGYTIIASNYRFQHLELDIIAEKDGQLIFFEVKTRAKNEIDGLDIPLATRQVRNLKRAVIAYCLQSGNDLNSVRLDLITITADRAASLASLKHYKDIF
ncbi:MAG: YraN family protein [Patescibacteria group bacterium]|jgi:putative endonuclease